LNAQGAISSLLAGFVLGGVRFVLEILDRAGGGHRFENFAIRWIVDINFLHYAILMFIICSLVLVGVSLATPAPNRRRLAGLTFATVDDKMEVTAVQPSAVQRKPAAETGLEHKVNLAFSIALFLAVVGLWIYFR
jgi:SSS family solute:Na+ symporter